MARILVVDDSGDLRQVLFRLLTRAGHQPVLATGGAEALGVLAREPVDLVLLDISMPDMDGLDVLAALRTPEGKPRIPVMMMTALSGDPERRRAADLGACDYLVKSLFDYTELEARLRRHLPEANANDNPGRRWAPGSPSDQGSS